jgi:hypothetical protein
VDPDDAGAVAAVRQLPEYCQRQFRPKPIAPGAPKTKSTGKRTCPVNMNHFCPGLVALNRANNMLGSKSDRRFILGIAQKEIAEVQKQMTPACRRAADVDAAAQRVKMMRMLQK